MVNPAKEIGKIKEQVLLEDTARRHFVQRWGNLNDQTLNRFYNPKEIEADLKAELQLRDLCPYTRYTGEGEGHFLSPEMHNSLIATCRCGLPRSEAHLVRCVQKEKDWLAAKCEDAVAGSAQGPLVAPTSNAAIGWQQQQVGSALPYQRWEHSMKYVSPVYNMPGHRVTATPYAVIHIG